MCGLRVLAFRGLLRLIVQSLRSLGHGTNQQFKQCNKFRMFGLLGDMLFALRGGHAIRPLTCSMPQVFCMRHLISLVVVVRGPMVHAIWLHVLSRVNNRLGHGMQRRGAWDEVAIACTF